MKANLEEKFIKLDDQVSISYHDEGKGKNYLFIHGNPTSKFLWRNIVKDISKNGRAIAPDLLGMGNSSRKDNSFTFEEQYNYLKQFIFKKELKNIILVVHDWGGALGIYFAKKHPELIKGICAMEFLYNPEISLKKSGLIPWLIFKILKTPFIGKKLILNFNIFHKVFLPLGTLRKIPKDILEEYNRPYLNKNKRQSLMDWIEEIPYKNHHARNKKIILDNYNFFQNTSTPKLLFHVWPGFAIPR